MSDPSEGGADPALPAPGESGVRPSYDGTAGEITRIALHNALLNLVTLGIYRFWAKTRLRGYIWPGVRLHGDRLEYTGRGGELFVGFLIAFAILTVFVLIVEAAMAMAGEGSTTADVIGALQGLAIFLLIYVAIFRARRYRLSRTQWRGIRGGQSGSSIRFALLALGWMIVVVLTLGLAYPVLRTRLARYQMENTWFGSQTFALDARAGELFGSWFLAWLFLLPSLGLTYIWYRVKEFRYFASRTRFGPLACDSDLRAGPVIATVVLYLFTLLACLAVVLGAAYLVVTSGDAVPVVSEGGEQMVFETAAEGPRGLILFVLFLLLVVLAGILRTVLFIHPLIGRIVPSLSVRGEMDFEALAQSQQEMPWRGEGLADSLDVGGI
jgi:uncharacterized membrane protein YjgN (DUF898 family)